jgi:hypothetical protein
VSCRRRGARRVVGVRRLAVFAGVLASAASALAGAGGVAGAGAAPLRTTDAIYEVFGPTGGVSLQTKTESGSCFSGSDATQRSDAWRCSSGNELLDPCFSSPLAAGTVVCPAAPWLHTGITIRLTQPLPSAEADHGAASLARLPWALELYDGSRCLLATGATSVLDGRRLNYFCGGQSKTGLWGAPNRSTQPWRIYRAAFTAKRLTQRVAVRRAWA